MTTKPEALAKIAAAEKTTSAVLAAMEKAQFALRAGLLCNGYGVFSYPTEARAVLRETQEQIRAALAALDAGDWPTDADYDQL